MRVPMERYQSQATVGRVFELSVGSNLLLEWVVIYIGAENYWPCSKIIIPFASSAGLVAMIG